MVGVLLAVGEGPGVNVFVAVGDGPGVALSTGVGVPSIPPNIRKSPSLAKVAMTAVWICSGDWVSSPPALANSVESASMVPASAVS